MENLDSGNFLLKMRELYLSGIGKKIDGLHQLLIRCRLYPSDSESFAELNRNSFALIGSGGSFGFPLITQAAELIQNDLDAITNHGKKIDDYFFLNFLEFLAR